MLRDKILRETYEAVVITGHYEGRRISAAQARGKISRGNKFAKARYRAQRLILQGSLAISSTSVTL
jgi:hypothetical protein